MSEPPPGIARAIERARHLVDRGRFEEAMAALDEVPATFAQAPLFHYARANVAMGAGDWPAALAILDELIGVEPARAVLHLDRIRCLIELGDLDRAARELAREDSPIRDRFPRFVFQAWIAARLGEVESSCHLLKDAIDRDPAARDMARTLAGLAEVVDALELSGAIRPTPGGTPPGDARPPASGRARWD